jgi:hypothetical protein
VSPIPKSSSRRKEKTGINMPNLLKRSILAFAMPGDMIRVTHLGNTKEPTSKTAKTPLAEKLAA